MSDIKVTHEVEFKNSGLESMLSSLAEAVSKLNDTMGTTSSSVKQAQATAQPIPSQATQPPSSTVAGDIIKNSKDQQAIANKQLDAMIKNTATIDANNKAIKTSQVQNENITAKQAARSKLAIDTANKLSQIALDTRRGKNDIDDSRSWQKMAKGMVLGGALSTVYQMQNFGSTAGKEAGAINQSASNYVGFQRNLYNMQMQNQSNSAVTGAGIAGGVLGLLASNGNYKVATIASALATAAGGYFANKDAEKNKASYELATQTDLDAWRLQQMGISGRSSLSIKSGGNILGNNNKLFGMTKFQEQAQSQGGFAKDVVDIVLNSRRDIMMGMNDSDKTRFATNVQKGAMTIGVDATSLGNMVTQMSANTGKSTDSIMKEILNNAKKYGGDTISNLVKVQQIMQTTPFGEKGAASLVNTYQYNDAMIKNKLSASIATPTNLWKSGVIAQMAGLSNTEYDSLKSGVIPHSVQSRYRNAQSKAGRLGGGALDMQSMMMDQVFASLGLNPQVNNIGKNTGFKLNEEAIKNAPSEPQTFSEFNKMVATNLREITVNGNITVNGDTAGKSQGYIQDYLNSRSIGLSDNGQSSKVEKDL